MCYPLHHKPVYKKPLHFCRGLLLTLNKHESETKVFKCNTYFLIPQKTRSQSPLVSPNSHSPNKSNIGSALLKSPIEIFL
jgi:hypothetical protein